MDRGRARDRPRRRARAAPRVARRGALEPRAAGRAADARALPGRQAGGRARGVPEDIPPFVDEIGGPPGARLQRLHTRDPQRRGRSTPDRAAGVAARSTSRRSPRCCLRGSSCRCSAPTSASSPRSSPRGSRYPASDPPDLTRVAQYVALTKGSGPLADELRDDARGEPAAGRRCTASSHRCRRCCASAACRISCS